MGKFVTDVFAVDGKLALFSGASVSVYDSNRP